MKKRTCTLDSWVTNGAGTSGKCSGEQASRNLTSNQPNQNKENSSLVSANHGNVGDFVEIEMQSTLRVQNFTSSEYRIKSVIVLNENNHRLSLRSFC